ncbi:hypothetical protein CYY_006088 [Polysphondylium violaceum]|uniref:Uncharacterized protein n=1 Tax=Polysphondylium violaceum TaxID=133409 RepID=A0A8J4PSU0_9MYCE|nr:hypothetical protein CYY_006088 [Polysphondylium violaceum]
MLLTNLSQIVQPCKKISSSLSLTQSYISLTSSNSLACCYVPEPKVESKPESPKELYCKYCGCELIETK